MITFQMSMVILTSIYVLGTLLLFGWTAYEIRLYRKEIRHRAVLEMATSNREILAIGINNPVLLKLFGTEQNQEDELVSRYAQLWINQAHAIWHGHTVGLIADEEWLPVKQDILKMFQTRPAVKRRWETTKWAYPKKFQNLIDGALQ